MWVCFCVSDRGVGGRVGVVWFGARCCWFCVLVDLLLVV